MTDAKIDCIVRDSLGSRNSRRLRAHGRMVGNLQADADHPQVNVHFDEADFHTARRQHVHLFDLQFDGKSEAAIINELQWDAFGDTLVHVEFKRVVRGQKTESTVPLRFTGTPAGILNHDTNEISILSIPSMIPDSITISVDGLEPGSHVKAKDVVCPEGVELNVDPETDIANITELGRHAASSSDDDADGEAEGEGDSA